MIEKSNAWGLIPFWAKDAKIGNSLINARSETVETKPAFRHAFQKKRCLIPVDGFYEWKRDGKTEQPFHIQMRDESIFALAGLWEIWDSPQGAVESCSLITTTPNELMAEIHDRMPVILDKEAQRKWLDPKAEPTQLRELLRPFPAAAMEAYPVSTLVNKLGFDAPVCCERVELPPAVPQSGSLF